MNFKIYKLDKFVVQKGLLIDVRSPDEYYKGNMPNSINIPLFNNEERSTVGKIYKNKGRDKAVIVGLEIVDRKMNQLIDRLIKEIETYNNDEKLDLQNEKVIKIYCSRGGMRSKSMSWLLEKLGFNNVTLVNGYKNYRRWVLESFLIDRKIILIAGKTGSGKTKMLNELSKLKQQIIDLEQLASHRGSTFGGLGMANQPSNEQFENKIAEQLKNYNNKKPIFIEAESANIGKCKIPHSLFNQMKESPRLEIIRTEEERINELVETYSIYSQTQLKEAVLRIKKRLGPQRTSLAINAIEKKEWSKVCKAVLEYYDKCYDHENKNKLKIKTINMCNIDPKVFFKDLDINYLYF